MIKYNDEKITIDQAVKIILERERYGYVSISYLFPNATLKEISLIEKKLWEIKNKDTKQ